jgi:acyl carrier protein
MVDPAKIKEVMAAVLEVDTSTISEEASMDSIPTWNSLRQMSLVLALEEEFGVSFPDEDAANATSFRLLSIVLHELIV